MVRQSRRFPPLIFRGGCAVHNERTAMEQKTIMARSAIRKKLQALVLVVVLPAVAVIVATGLNQRRSEIEEARRNALFMVKSLTAQQEQIASATKTMLTLLAQLPAVRSRDARECNHLFGEIHRQFPEIGRASCRER